MTGPLAYIPPAYIPLVTPLPLWNYWAWLLVPLCVAVAVVYKTIKCRYVSQVPREAAILALWILLSMAGVAVAVQAVYFVMVQWLA